MAKYLCGLTPVAPDLLRRGQRGAILQPDNLVYNTCVAKLRAGEQIVSRNCANGFGWIPPGSNQAFIVPPTEKAMRVGHERG